MSKKMSAGAKGVGLVVGGCVITIGVTFLMIVLAVALFIDTTRCSAVSRSIPVLWGSIAAVFLASGVIVGFVARKVFPEAPKRLAVMVAYGAVMLASFVVIAISLLVVLNC